MFGRGGLEIQAIGMALGSHYESHWISPLLASFFRAIHDFSQSPYRSEREPARAMPARELALAVYFSGIGTAFDTANAPLSHCQDW